MKKIMLLVSVFVVGAMANVSCAHNKTMVAGLSAAIGAGAVFGSLVSQLPVFNARGIATDRDVNKDHLAISLTAIAAGVLTHYGLKFGSKATKKVLPNLSKAMKQGQNSLAVAVIPVSFLSGEVLRAMEGLMMPFVLVSKISEIFTDDTNDSN